MVRILFPPPGSRGPSLAWPNSKNNGILRHRGPGPPRRIGKAPAYCVKGAVMTDKHFAEGQILFREGDPADCVFRLLRGAVDIFRELDGEPILLGTVGAGQ